MNKPTCIYPRGYAMQQVASTAFKQYQQELLAYIIKKIGHRDDAQDILSGVFVKLLQQQTPPNSPIAWLYQVTKNAIIDYYRTRKPNEALPEDLLQEVEKSDAFRDMSECMRPMIMTLDDKYQHVLLLSELEGFKHQAVADQLNLSLPAVKSRVRRGRQLLASSIQGCCAPVVNKSGRIDDFDTEQANCKGC
ncbi:sigma-70 family RNA polymerase sigma factor [Shewanella sp. Scap07]|uniref:sigma-70 family RNA polymerase sigma factor n=1 Tax=Shewanella sp. Scap07 TaxID=2589987 RepID=UPI0015BE60B6|nr:sigma-70 family RNA polymerase sigma factor [Shewanella sp. Scap07]